MSVFLPGYGPGFALLLLFLKLSSTFFISAFPLNFLEGKDDLHKGTPRFQ